MVVLVPAITRHTGIRLAEVGFLIILFGGAWLASAQIPRLKIGTLKFIGGGALALGAIFLIVAIHWGHFG